MEFQSGIRRKRRYKKGYLIFPTIKDVYVEERGEAYVVFQEIRIGYLSFLDRKSVILLLKLILIIYTWVEKNRYVSLKAPKLQHIVSRTATFCFQLILCVVENIFYYKIRLDNNKKNQYKRQKRKQNIVSFEIKIDALKKLHKGQSIKSIVLDLYVVEVTVGTGKETDFKWKVFCGWDKL